jgi:hypothetical protein
MQSLGTCHQRGALRLRSRGSPGPAPAAATDAPGGALRGGRRPAGTESTAVPRARDAVVAFALSVAPRTARRYSDAPGLARPLR